MANYYLNHETHSGVLEAHSQQLSSRAKKKQEIKVALRKELENLQLINFGR